MFPSLDLAGFQISSTRSTPADNLQPPSPYDPPQTHAPHEDVIRTPADLWGRQTASEIPSNPLLDQLIANMLGGQPHIQVVNPISGPLNGGIEAIILGANFGHSHLCVFGDAVAQTTWWNSGTLRCIVPPAAVPGPVVITIQGHPLVVGGGEGAGGSHTPVWFNYEDTRENDL